MPRLSKIGAAALAAFGWTGLSTVTATYLQVAGGGGGAGYVGGGGGAGGYLSGTTSLNPTLSYTVTVGAGGIGGAGAATGANGTNGSNSQFGTLTASVGGGAGGSNGGTNTGANGGSGGGGCGGGLAAGGTATSGQGNAGGTGGLPINYGGAGGGGAGAVGGNGSTTTGGNGGAGSASSITGTSVTYAGGGGGGAAGAASGNNPGIAGTANLGGGGGAASFQSSYVAGGNGGSGVVIISYPSPQKFGGGIVTTSGSNTIHTFQTSGTLSPLSTLTASYLIVAGGGGAGANNGGGSGAGGFLSGSGLTIDTNSIYVVTVGAGGTGTASTSVTGGSGTNSVFGAVATTAVGGGGGGGSAAAGANGGSGGGGGNSAGSSAFGTGTSGQGNNGGVGFQNAPNYAGGGGGGAGAVGSNAGSGSGSGVGGVGLANPIAGSTAGQLVGSTYYLAGGGGAGQNTGTAGAGGYGGGGAGSVLSPGTAGTANTGGGGGGAGGSNLGGAGGSGVVIISYAGSVQQMAGGTVTISGGNVIHTFTSSGYLTPLKLVNNSLRFRSSASAYLNRSFTTPTSQQKGTMSMWVKRGLLSSSNRYNLFSNDNGTQFGYIEFNNDSFNFGDYNIGTLTTTQVFRDPAAWYHFVLSIDTTQVTASNRYKLYVNGSQITSFSTATYPTQNANSYFLQAGSAVQVANFSRNGTPTLDGYLTEVNFIDGQQLTPNSFGTFNSYGVWQPITYGGSYGTNGFYLPFTNKTSTTTLGYDFSPNGNNWTTNNISLTAGSTYDSMTDVPTLTSATAANYCVLNPLASVSTYTFPLSDGNLTASGSSGSYLNDLGTMYFDVASATGYYWEFYSDASSYSGAGITSTTFVNTSIRAVTNGGSAGYTWATMIPYSAGSLYVYNNGAGTYATTSRTLSAGWYGVAVKNGKVWFRDSVGWFTGDPVAGTSPLYTGLTGNYTSCLNYESSGSTTAYINFGQQPFAYTPPTGFVALNTYNL